MNLDLYTRFTESYTSLCRRLEDADERVLSYERQLDEVLSESSLLERCRDAMGSAKELLTKSSLTQCERLATLAVRSIFGLDAKVVYDSAASKFLLDYGDGKKSDLTTAQSGGLMVVVSFVFTLYLIMKHKSRRVLFMDEAWVQVSAAHYPRFIDFVRTICRDFGFEILLVSHDARLTLDMCDRCYEIRDGEAHRLK